MNLDTYERIKRLAQDRCNWRACTWKACQPSEEEDDTWWWWATGSSSHWHPL